MADTKVGALRLRAVRFKNGGEIRLLPGIDPEDDRRYAQKKAKQVIDAYPDRVAGMAIVVWGADNGSTALVSVNEASRIPSIMVPDFVRARLLAQKIEEWTLGTLTESTE